MSISTFFFFLVYGRGKTYLAVPVDATTDGATREVSGRGLDGSTTSSILIGRAGELG